MSEFSPYSEKVMDHFQNPRNIGEIKNPDGLGRVGNPTCGDIMLLTIKVGERDSDEYIEDIKFKTFGCAAAIATSSMITEMAKGKSLKEAYNIERKDVSGELGGLPPVKEHCSNLSADALKKAVDDYKNKKN